MNLETVIDDCGSTLTKMADPSQHPAYSHISHTPTFIQAKVTLDGQRSHLVKAREDLKAQWRHAESRILMAKKVEKYKDKAEKVYKLIFKLFYCTVMFYMAHLGQNYMS